MRKFSIEQCLLFAEKISRYLKFIQEMFLREVNVELFEKLGILHLFFMRILENLS